MRGRLKDDRWNLRLLHTLTSCSTNEAPMRYNADTWEIAPMDSPPFDWVGCHFCCAISALKHAFPSVYATGKYSVTIFITCIARAEQKRLYNDMVLCGVILPTPDPFTDSANQAAVTEMRGRALQSACDPL